MADSTSVNLYKLALAALRLQTERKKIVTDDLNFPSDMYILNSVAEAMGDCEIAIVNSEDGIHGDLKGLEAAVDRTTALLTLSHTVFKSGFTYDLRVVTELAHEAGALVLWDLSHSVGAMPIDLNQSSVDMAVGCSYKYLNGGPGAPAFLYVRSDLQDRLSNPVAGWMGQNQPFEFSLTYEPVAGLRRFLSGTPPILSLAAAESGVELIIEAGIDAIRAKSIKQTDYFVELWEKSLRELGYILKSPSDSRSRGSHVSLGHSEGWRINKALITQKNVIPDFRLPDNIRVGFAPLYNSFADVYRAADALRDVVESGLYRKLSKESDEIS